MDRISKVFELMYIGTCNVIENKKVSDPVTKRTSFEPVTIISNQPCRLSHKSSPITGDGNTASVMQEIKLFLSPDVKIPNGCKIEVTQRGETKAYTNSSEPQIFDNHQEITLKLFERWA